MTRCDHRFKDRAGAVRTINDPDTGLPYLVELEVRCACGVPLRFDGLPVGVDLHGGATVSICGDELRVAASMSDGPTPVRKAGELRGFRVTQVKP